MNTRELSLAGVILLVVLGIRIAPSTGKPSTTSAEATKTEAKSGQAAIRTPPVWRALCQLNPTYGADPEVDKKLETIPSGVRDPDCLRKFHPNEDWITSVIATVAAPDRTNLGLGTDRTVETIQAATAEADYIPYLQGLPWRNLAIPNFVTETATNQLAGNSSEKSGAGKKTDYSYPGVLIFRAPGTLTSPRHPKYLAVFLVSETPTSGLDKEQFLAALRIIGDIPRSHQDKKGKDKNKRKEPRQVLVAGPNFSGSVASLRQLADVLSQPAQKGAHTFANTVDPVRCLHAFSGTVTNPDMNVADGSCPLKLERIQTDDGMALCGFRTWATQVGFREEQVAILSEEGTQYGRQEQATKDAQSGSNSLQKLCDKPDHFLRLHFPRGIAALRNATDPGQGPQVGIAAGNGPQRLPVRWQDSESQSDEVPIYGGYQTSMSEETVLASLADTLKTENTKALGIMASDPWDVTFLIHWFAEATPNVRLFVRDVDLLYLRTPDLGSVTGILAVNDYPLISQNQLWSADQAHLNEHHFLTLPSSSQEAQFNAFTELIEQLHPQLADHSLKHLEDQGRFEVEPGTPQQHLWLAATGTTGYLPIKPLWDEKIGLFNTRTNLHSLDIEDPPYAAIILFFLFALVAVAHAIWVLAATWSRYRNCETDDQQNRPKTALSCFVTFDLGDPKDAVGASKYVCHAVALSAAALATLIGGASFIFFWQSPFSFSLGSSTHSFSIPLNKLLAGLVLSVTAFVPAVALFCLVAGIWICRERSRILMLSRKDQQGLRTLVRWGAIFVGIPLIGMAYWVYRTLVGNFDNAFMHLRDLRLGSGIAPSLPILILIAVYYSGIWVYLRRISRWEYGSAEMPTGLDEVFPSDCNEYVRRITGALVRFPESPWGWILLACSIGAFLLFRPWATLEMLEPLSVQRFTVACFALTLLLLWGNWLRFLYIWQQMQLFLRVLEKLPLRAAFSRISTQSALLIWGWNPAPGKLLPVREAVEALRGLERLTGDTFVTAATRKKFFQTTRDLLIATSDVGSDVIELCEEEVEEPHASEPKRSEHVPHPVETVVYQARSMMAVAAEGASAASEEILSFDRQARELDRVVRISASSPGPMNGNCAPSSAVTKPKRMSAGQLKQLYHESRQAMLEVILQLRPHLSVYWHRGEIWPGNFPIPLDRPRRKTDSEDERYQLAEELVALRYYSYIRYVGTELRNLLMFVILAFFGLFVALHSYAFRAGRTIDIALITLFVILVIGIILALGQQERDALLSRLQRSNAGELNTNFYLDVAKYAVLPALALIASHVPSISNFFLRWIQPGVDAFH